MRDPTPGYSIRKTIGESDKALVYLASSEKLGTDVALKVTKSDNDDQQDQQVFAREYEAAGRYCAIPIDRRLIYDYGTNAGREFLAMRSTFRAGISRASCCAAFSRRMRCATWSRSRVPCRWCMKPVFCIGTLKPPNLMLRENDTIALIDFGLARSFPVADTAAPAPVKLRGSPYYMSPEQALGEEP